MRIKEIRIQNFRSFKDQTVTLDGYTCLVGPNGAGKSAVLMALNVFFRSGGAAITNVHTLSNEDFHFKNTGEPVRITLTFTDLSEGAQADLAHYFRQGQLTITAKAEWDSETRSAEVKQYGSRLVMKDFAPFFRADETGAKVPELRDLYSGIRAAYPDLPEETTKQRMKDALRGYEESHEHLLEDIEAATEFYGWSRGANLLEKHIQWVYVPAVKDASGEQDESAKTALGQLVQRTVRAAVSFDRPLQELRDEVAEKYCNILDTQKGALDLLQKSIESKLRQWASPNAELFLNWKYDPDKSVALQQPIARASIGEDSFVGDVARLGHGMQRAFIVSMLQELATTDVEAAPTLLLGFEEPELYQHPPQAQHVAALLAALAEDPKQNTQVLVTTHSPYFVPGKGFEAVRMFRKDPKGKHTRVTQATYAQIEESLARALGKKAGSPSATMAAVEQIMQPSQRELFFCKTAVLVEGIADVAFISAHMHLEKKWSQFRRNGCHFVVADGKTNLSRPLAIANALKIRAFTVFDADVDCKKDDLDTHARDNSCILRLCGLDEFDPLPKDVLWRRNVVAWPTRIERVVKEELGEDVWQEAQQEARDERDFPAADVTAKNCLLIAAIVEKLHANGHVSKTLDKLSQSILSFSREATAN